MLSIGNVCLIVLACLVVAIPVTVFATNAYRKNVSEKKIGNAEEKAREIIDEALKTAEASSHMLREVSLRSVRKSPSTV